MTAPGVLTQVDDAEVEQPRDGEVLVRVRWCSACHSDLHALDGVTPAKVPAILGHEAAGIVEAVGASVDDLAVGDRVVLSMVGPCGECAYCMRGVPMSCPNSFGRGGVAADGGTRIVHGGEQVWRALRVGGFSEYTVVPRKAAVRVPAELPLDLASVLGCSVLTGYGAVVNIAQVQPGDSVAVIGLGAVGIAAIQAARIAGASHIVGVDPLTERRELALKVGATAVFAPEDATADLVRQTVGELLPDVTVDTVTKPVTTQQAVRLVRPGGTVVVIGVTPPGEQLALDAMDVILSQKRLAGCYLGNCVPERDISILVELWRGGKLDLDSMVTGRRSLDELGHAFDDLRAGIGLRTAVEVSPVTTPTSS
ncbi:alcohol dehydrogenase catalytic domain-containing protein [Streptomyces sp. NPDC090499]|uniref:alcohol dehydrogenase catalytic domain-containing protein n=1 Tax=unclassified Streptomyces TaxID=2593676 RepID=UPI0037FFC6A0